MITYSLLDYKCNKDRSNEILSDKKYKEVSQKAMSEFSYTYKTNLNNAVNNLNVFPYDPSYRLQHFGVSLDETQSLIDVESKLYNLNMKYKKDLQNNLNTFQQSTYHNFEDGFISQESSKLSNPTLILKGQTINRFYKLHNNPQENCLESFDRLGQNTYLETIDKIKH